MKPTSYPLRYDGSWHLDFQGLETSLGERSRAIVVVHPNNPTGSYLSREIARDSSRSPATRASPSSSTRSFSIFRWKTRLRLGASRDEERGLVFVLSGLSKLAGLPQMKLSWIVASGDRDRVAGASLRLEHIGDTYLSVGAPVQVAARRLLEIGASVRGLISERARHNLGSLVEWIGDAPAVTLVPPEGGWYAAIRLPAIRSSEEWALRLLEKESVYVHPGSFFGFDIEGIVVSSLLTPIEIFSRGVHRILSLVADELDSADA